MVRKLIGLLLAALLVFAVRSFAQQPGNAPKGSLIGIVVGESSPLISAAITVRQVNDTAVVAKALTGQDGHFAIVGLPLGTYYINVTYIGYKQFSVSKIALTTEAPQFDVGMIKMRPDMIALVITPKAVRTTP
jgi:hypothetical protein